ncbi:hypothetical protein GN956_G10838 [Arapaima gigas]
MRLLFAITALTLLSVSRAAPMQCEVSVKQLILEDFTPILGKWIFLEGTADHQKHESILKLVNSSWVEFLPTSYDDTVTFNQGNMINGKCLHESFNLTFVNNTFTVTHENATSSGILLHTCPDCLLVMFSSFYPEGTIRSFYILGKAKELSITDLETYRRQSECQGFPKAPFIYDGQSEFCPPKQEITASEDPDNVKH